jgi:hypothetical protein
MNWSQARADIAATLPVSTLIQLDGAAELAGLTRQEPSAGASQPGHPADPLLVLRVLLAAGQTESATLAAGILIGPARRGGCRLYRVAWRCGEDVAGLLSDVLSIASGQHGEDSAARIVHAARRLAQTGADPAVSALVLAEMSVNSILADAVPATVHAATAGGHASLRHSELAPRLVPRAGPGT